MGMFMVRMAITINLLRNSSLNNSIENISNKVIHHYRYRISTVEFLENGMVVIKIDDNEEMQLEDSQFHQRVLREHYDEYNKFLILVEPGRYSSISKEARDWSSDPANSIMTKATAVIVHSLAQRLIINFVITFSRQQNMKMRMFEDKEKAIEWFMSLR